MVPKANLDLVTKDHRNSFVWSKWFWITSKPTYQYNWILLFAQFANILILARSKKFQNSFEPIKGWGIIFLIIIESTKKNQKYYINLDSDYPHVLSTHLDSACGPSLNMYALLTSNSWTFASTNIFPRIWRRGKGRIHIITCRIFKGSLTIQP